MPWKDLHSGRAMQGRDKPGQAWNNAAGRATRWRSRTSWEATRCSVPRISRTQSVTEADTLLRAILQKYGNILQKYGNLIRFSKLACSSIFGKQINIKYLYK